MHSKDRYRRMKGVITDDIANSHNLVLQVALLTAGEPVPVLQPDEQAEIEVDRDVVENANAILRRLTEETRALLTEHWAAVERVAQALMSCDLLGQAELDRLIARP